MRWLVLILLTLLLGLIVGPLIQKVPGTMLIVFEQYSLQFRLWQGLVMLLTAALVFIFIYHLIIKLAGSAGRLQRWSGSRGFTKARQKTIQGMIALAEGHWAKAEKLLSQAATKTDTALINYLAAAQAAEAQNAHERRDQYLRLAHLAEPSAEIAVGLTQSQLQLRHGQVEEALASLAHLQQISPKHGPILLMLSKVYQQLGDWQRVIDLLPDLKKSKAISEQELAKRTQEAWSNHLKKQAEGRGAEGAQAVWSNMPRKLRHDEQLELLYYALLIQNNASLEAVQGLTQRVKQDASEPFLQLYGTLELDDVSQQLKLVERVGEKFNHSYVWLITAGKLALQAQIWGQAKSHFEQAVRLNPSSEAKQLLAIALDRMGMADEAYRQLKSTWSI